MVHGHKKFVFPDHENKKVGHSVTVFKGSKITNGLVKALYSVFSLLGGNQLNLLPQTTVIVCSYRQQPLEGLLKLYKLF